MSQGRTDPHNLVHGSLIRALAHMTVPIVVGDILQTGYNFIDTFFVSRIGIVEVGAVTFVMPIAFLIVSVAAGISTAGVSLISQSTGAGFTRRSAEFATHLILVGLGLSIVIGASGFVLLQPLVAGFGLTGALRVAVQEYLGFVFLATPFTFFTVIYAGIRQSQGRANKALVVTGISLLLNVVFNYLFIFQLSLGIRGAALATLCARAAAAVYGFVDLALRDRMLQIKPGSLRFQPTVAGLIVKLAVPAAVARGATSLSFLVLNTIIVNFGTEVLAAFGIGSRINSLFFLPSTGFGLALSTIVGQSLGAGQSDRARDAVQLTMIVSVGFALIGAATLYTFSRSLAQIFSSDVLVLHHTVNYLNLVAVTVVPWAVFQTLAGVFQGAGFTRTAMTISLVRLWVLRIPLLVVIHRFTDVGAFSIWYSMLISNVLTAGVSIVLYYTIPWQRGLHDVLRS